MAHMLLFTTTIHILPVHSISFFPSILSRNPQRASQQQKPIMNIPIPGIPGSSDNNDDDPSTGTGDQSISDVIGKERTINIFAGFTRTFAAVKCTSVQAADRVLGDINSISERLDDQSKQTTVLAPLNSALTKLPRKPWEDPEDYNAMGAEAYKGGEGEDRATRNLRRFVEAHTIPASPWKEGEKVQSLRGETVWWEMKDGKKVVGITSS